MTSFVLLTPQTLLIANDNPTKLTNATMSYRWPSSIQTGVSVTASNKDVVRIAWREAQCTISLVTSRFVRAQSGRACTEVEPIPRRTIPFTRAIATVIFNSVEGIQLERYTNNKTFTIYTDRIDNSVWM